MDETKKKGNLPYRSLKDVPDAELKAAVMKMAADLGIAGSGNGYSLFTAIFSEKEKVLRSIALLEDEFKDK